MDYITSILKENRVFYPSHEFSRKSHIKKIQEYSRIYKKSIEKPEAFWAEKALQLDWFRKWDIVFRNDMGFFKWFEGGYLNVCHNCLDRIVKSGKGKKLAYIWEAESGETKTYTYEELLKEVCRLANVLKKKGIGKGDVVEIISEPFKKEKAKVIRVDKSKGEVVVSLLGAVVPIPVTVKLDNVRVIRREKEEEASESEKENQDETQENKSGGLIPDDY